MHKLVVLFPGIFVLVGLGLTYKGVKDLMLADASSSWPTTEGIIKVSQMGVHSDSDSGTTYSADISFDYELEGTPYTSSKVKIGNIQTSDSSDARRVLNKYPIGTKVSVFYQPEDPYVAVLEPGIHGSTYFLPIFGLFFAGFGVFFIFLILKGQRDTQRRLNETYPTPPLAKGKTIEELLKKRKTS